MRVTVPTSGSTSAVRSVSPAGRSGANGSGDLTSLTYKRCRWPTVVESAYLAPKNLELLQFMQVWHPRTARVLERLSDDLLPRGTAGVSENDFRVIADTLDARYNAATKR
jgi:hypothetical protein